MTSLIYWVPAIIVVLAIGALIAAMAADPPGKLTAGVKAPEVEMAGSDGNTYRTADFIGKQAVVIAWFPKAFTGG